MPNDAGAMICAVEARQACKSEPDLLERIRKAMRACHNHWMELDENQQFRGAVTAAILESPDGDKERIQKSMAALNKMNSLLTALQHGISVDLEAMASEPKDDDIIPLSAMWRETAKP